jgi:hypothetical protein
VQAAFLIPGKGLSHKTGIVDVSNVPRERSHVVGRIGQFKHSLADDLPHHFSAKSGRFVSDRRDNRQLFDNVPAKMVFLNFLSR